MNFKLLTPIETEQQHFWSQLVLDTPGATLGPGELYTVGLSGLNLNVLVHIQPITALKKTGSGYPPSPMDQTTNWDKV